MCEKKSMNDICDDNVEELMRMLKKRPESYLRQR